MRATVLFILFFTGVICGCNRRSYTADIERADSLTEASCPVEALAILEDIPARKLRGDDRALHALVTVKTHDKLNYHHTSDSTIRIAASYFHSHGSVFRRAEATFYNGRVLSDLQNHAAALDAYDDALNLLPTSDTIPSHLRLRSLINSLTAQLLTDLYLYQEAIPFYNTAIDISIALGDSANAVMDGSALIFNFIEIDSLESAQRILNKIKQFSPSLTQRQRANLEIKERFLFLNQGANKQAVKDIHRLIDAIHPNSRNFVYMVAMRAYDNLGITDSATYYAKALISQPKNHNKHIAFEILGHYALINQQISEAQSYYDSLRTSVTNLINVADERPSLISSEYIKHHLEEKKSIKLSQQLFRSRAMATILIIIIIIAAILIYLLWKRVKVNNQEGDNIVTNFRQLNSDFDSDAMINASNSTISQPETNQSREAQIKEILSRLETLSDKMPRKPNPLKQTQIYLTISSMANLNQHIPDDSKIWTDLEEAINKCHPRFSARLRMLLGDINQAHFRPLLLSKAGFGPTEIGKLTCRDRRTINSNRIRLCKKIFNIEITAEKFNRIIDLL